MSIMRMAFLLALTALAASACRAQGGPEDERSAEMMKRYEARTKIFKPCPVGRPGEIVVCARPEEEAGARFRLPIPPERDTASTVPGEAPRASAAPVKQGGCSIVSGDPPICNKGLTVVKTGY